MPDFDVIVTGGPGAAGSVVVEGSPSATTGSGMVGVPTFISATAPDVPGPWAWWDTSTPDLTLWIDDGEA